MKNIFTIINAAIGAAMLLVPTIGDDAHGAVERAALVPQSDREKALLGMSDADKRIGHELFKRVADSISDLAVFIASRGKIKPD